ncbi:MAG: DUF2029 domain-containing protein [Candidatus Hydrogenedentes bacterium]|nr:DUF2029 domain-containing protein [Candidatus Hydrogenedentota bacterium]
MAETIGRRAGLLVLTAGIVATLLLQLAVPSMEVFWSGDGGLKNLQAKQFAHGDMHVDLRLTEKEWVRTAWDEGLHPGEYGNYIYKIDGKYFSVFPYPFPLVSAPFYALFGDRGYYVIPVIALWVVWITIYLAMQRACIDPWMKALLMLSLVFAMPVTLYAATFWEHTLGLALAMTGIVYTLRYDDFEPGKTGPLLAGGALGFAVWFRPETLALTAILLPAAFLWRRRALTFRGWLLFSVAAVGVSILFFVVNYWIYGHPLGTHGIQMRSTEIAATTPHAIVDRFVSMAKMTIRFAPVGGFVAAIFAVLLISKRIVWQSEYVYLTVVAIVFFPLMVYMVPSDGGFQPGPRFVFIAFLLMILIAAYAWRAVPRNYALRVALSVLLIGTILVGVKRSAISETRWLIKQYDERVLPAYMFLAKRDEQVVALSRVEILLELGGLVEQKDFFAAFDDEKFSKMIEVFRAQKINKFLYIGFGDLKEEHDSALRHDVAKGLQVESLGHYGTHFYFYSVTIPQGA